jgi:hypothetical protein
MNINKWKQSGNIYIWKYRSNPRNYPGWHLNADKQGCDSLIEFLSLLSDEDSGLKRTINLSKPDSRQYNVPTSQYKVKAEAKLVIIKSPKENDFHFSYDSDKLTLNIGGSQIPEFVRGLTDVANGKGDYCIGDDGQELWFWWAERS